MADLLDWVGDLGGFIVWTCFVYVAGGLTWRYVWRFLRTGLAKLGRKS